MVTFTGQGNSIILRNPKFGDSDEIEHIRINRETRGGEKIIYRDPKWPIIERMKLQFEDLSQIDIKNVLSFIYKTVGKDVTYVDMDGREWVGVILNPDAEGTQPLRAENARCGGFEIEINFEGKLV